MTEPRAGSKANLDTSSRIEPTAPPGNEALRRHSSRPVLLAVALASALLAFGPTADGVAQDGQIPVITRSGTPLGASASLPSGTAEEKPIGAEAFAEEPIPLAATPRQVFRPSRKSFTIASWHLGATTTSATQKTQAPRPERMISTWRHTFGSERRTAGWRKIADAGFAADIVALQGVRSVGDARRLFHARSHHLVLSRQLLTPSGTRSTGIAIFRSEAPETTALAYRRQRGARLAGFRHFLPPAMPAGQSTNAKEAAAITAFRLWVYGKMIWIASADLEVDCAPAATASSSCQQTAAIIGAFGAWVEELGPGSAPLILLGRWPGSLPKLLKKVGFELDQQAAKTRGDCSPKPSGVLLAVPPNSGSVPIKMVEKTMPKRANACAYLAGITILFGDEKPGTSGETARRADRR